MNSSFGRSVKIRELTRDTMRGPAFTHGCPVRMMTILFSNSSVASGKAADHLIEV